MPTGGQLSDADIEGIIGRALRKSLLAGSKSFTKVALGEVVDGFMPSTQGLEKAGKRAAMQERLTALKQLVAGNG